MKTLILLFALSVPSFAAIQAGMQWDIRTTATAGNVNGGGFDDTVVSPGTDYSLQDGTQIAFTDLVIGGTTTQGTSVLHPFDSTSPGNVINVVSGATCTVQRVEVISVSGVTATFDKSLGTAAATCTGNLGGALKDVSTAVAAMGTAGNTIWVKSGTYTYTAQTTWQTSAALGAYRVIGYTTTHDDSAATRPLITTATNSVNLVGIQTNNNWVTIKNINFSNTAGTPGAGIFSSSGTNFPSFYIVNSKLSGFTNGIANTNSYGALVLVEVEITGCTSNGFQVPTNTTLTVVVHSNIHDNTGTTGGTVAGNGNVFIAGSLFTKNPIGLQLTSSSSMYMASNTIADNTGDGVKFGHGTSTNFFASNNIFYGNGGYGIDDTAASPTTYFLETNAYGGNSPANLNHMTVESTNLGTSIANPFVSDSTGNFALNNTIGAGAGLRGTASPGTFAGGLTTGYLDLGAVQSQASSGTRAYATSQ